MCTGMMRPPAFLQHAIRSGEHAALARVLAVAGSAPASPAGRFAEIVGRLLYGLLGLG
jgi:hypothetical protein